MSKEEQLYLKLLGDFANERASCPEKEFCADSFDWDRIIEISKTQNTGGIVFYQSKSFLPPKAAGSLMALYQAELFQYGIRKREAADITAAFEEGGIDYYAVKGLGLAEYYPVPAFRTMGDCDFVVHPEDLEYVDSVMTSLDYQNVSRNKEWVYLKKKLEMEIHPALMYENLLTNEAVMEYSNRAWEHVHDHRLDADYLYIYLLLHLKKHVAGSGVGFRQFLDIFLFQKKEHPGGESVDALLKDLGLEHFARVVGELNAAWFGTWDGAETKGQGRNAWDADLTEEFICDVTGRIFQGGVFGREDEEHEQNGFFWNLTEGHRETVQLFSRIRVLNRQLFPPLKTMKDYPEYGFLKTKPYLLPAAWGKRFLVNLKRHGMKQGVMRVADRVNIPEEKLTEKQRYFRKWGIL